MPGSAEFESSELGRNTDAAWRRPGPIDIGLLSLAAFVLVYVAVNALHGHTLAGDAHNEYLHAARDVVHGRSPYHPSAIPQGTAFGSPPIAAFVYAPFLVYGSQLTDALMAVLALASILGALAIVGLRDWRCYAVAALSYPVIFEFQTANLSGPILLCAAVVWRYRDRSIVAGAAAGIAVALKLFAWPLIVFLLVRRCGRAAVIAVAVAALAIVLPWAAIEFAGLRGYPHVLSALADFEHDQVYSVAALFASVLPWGEAQAGAYAVGAALLVGAKIARRAEAAFALCVAACLVFSPIVWPHYFVLLFAPLAVARPRFGPLWLLPLAFWLSPSVNATHVWQIAAVTLIQVVLIAAIVVRPRLRGVPVAPTG